MSEAAVTLDAPVSDAPASAPTEVVTEAVTTPTESAREAEPVAVAPSQFDQFLGTLPAEMRADPLWKQYEERGLPGVAKDFSELQKLMGSQDRIHRPKTDAPKEAWDKFYNTLGRPETPEGYDLKDFVPPAGMPWNTDQQGRLVEKMHGLGLTNDQMKGALMELANDQGAEYQKSIESAQDMRAQAEKDLRSEWGVAYDSKMEQAERAWVYAFGDAAASIGDVEIPGFGRFGAIPAVVQAFAKLGEAGLEDKLVTGETSQAGGLMTAEAAKEEFERMASDPNVAKVLSGDKHTVEYKATSRQWARLAAMAYPE